MDVLGLIAGGNSPRASLGMKSRAGRQQTRSCTVSALLLIDLVYNPNRFNMAYSTNKSDMGMGEACEYDRKVPNGESPTESCRILPIYQFGLALMSCRLLPHAGRQLQFFFGALNIESSSRFLPFSFRTFNLFTECSRLFNTCFTSLLCCCVILDTSPHIKMQRALTSRAATSVLSPSAASRFRASGALSQQLRFAHKVRWLELEFSAR